MKTILNLILSFILLILIAVAGYAWTQRTALVSEALTERLGMHVQLQDVTFSPAHITLQGLYATDNKNTYQAERLTVRFSPFIWLQSTKQIREVELIDAKLNIILSEKSAEQAGLSLLKNGWKLLSKIPKLWKKDKKKKTSTNDSQKAFIINQLTATNLYIKIQDPIQNNKAYEFPKLPKITLYNISSDTTGNLKSVTETTIQLLIEQGLKP